MEAAYDGTVGAVSMAPLASFPVHRPIAACVWVQGVTSLEGAGFDIARRLLPRHRHLHPVVHEQVCFHTPTAPTSSFAVSASRCASAADSAADIRLTPRAAL